MPDSKLASNDCASTLLLIRNDLVQARNDMRRYSDWTAVKKQLDLAKRLVRHFAKTDSKVARAIQNHMDHVGKLITDISRTGLTTKAIRNIINALSSCILFLDHQMPNCNDRVVAHRKVAGLNLVTEVDRVASLYMGEVVKAVTKALDWKVTRVGYGDDFWEIASSTSNDKVSLRLSIQEWRVEARRRTGPAQAIGEQAVRSEIVARRIVDGITKEFGMT